MGAAISVDNSVPLKWRSISGRYTITISSTCFNKILKMAKNYYPNEVGTSLVGRYSHDGFDAYILDIVPLTADSKGSAISFYRGIEGLYNFFFKLWRKYVGKRHYVGEWHSHPISTPNPSSIDDMSQSSIVTNGKTNCPENILIIIGGNFFNEPEIGVFVYSRKHGRIDLLRDKKL